MADVTGTGNITFGELQSANTSAIRSKEIDADGDILTAEALVSNGSGLGYPDGETLSYITNIDFEELQCSGTGKADNLAGIARATCSPIKARFHISNTVIKARFRL